MMIFNLLKYFWYFQFEDQSPHLFFFILFPTLSFLDALSATSPIVFSGLLIDFLLLYGSCTYSLCGTLVAQMICQIGFDLFVRHSVDKSLFLLNLHCNNLKTTAGV